MITTAAKAELNENKYKQTKEKPQETQTKKKHTKKETHTFTQNIRNYNI